MKHAGGRGRGFRSGGRGAEILAVSIAVAVGWGLIAAQTGARLEYLDRLQGLAGRIQSAADGGPARQVLPNPYTDGYLWLHHAEQMQATGALRVRETAFDNAPDGRAVHWSALPLWWLIGLGGAMGRGIERVAPLAGPVLLAVALPAVAGLAARALGAVAAWIVVLALAGAFPLAESFLAGNVDHHGFIVLSTMATLLGLIAAWEAGRSGNERSAGRWMVVSALGAALGLWVSAVTTSMVLAGIGLGAVLAGWSTRRAETEPGLSPALWRRWGMAGAIGSLACYALEYVPAHLGWRLEVNHPLYALAFWGGGELLAAATGPDRRRAFVAPRGFLAVAAVLALPIAILVGGTRVYALRDPLLWRLHQDIEEFRPITFLFDRLSAGQLAWAMSPLPLYLLIAGVLLGRSGRDPAARGFLLFALGPALLLGILALNQMRWMGIWLAALTVLAAVCARIDPADGSVAGVRSRWIGRALVFLPILGLAAGGVRIVSESRALARGRSVAAEDVASLIVCDMAQVVARDAGHRPAVVLASPDASVHLAWFGKLRGVGTLYWENRAGLAASTELFASVSAEEARLLLAERQIEYVVLFSERSFLGTFFQLAHGRRDDHAARETFFGRLLFSGAEPPEWLRPIPYALPMAALAGRPLVARVFAVDQK